MDAYNLKVFSLRNAVYGLQPNLAFTYNSQSQENEILGIHWQLTGLPNGRLQLQN